MRIEDLSKKYYNNRIYTKDYEDSDPVDNFTAIEPKFIFDNEGECDKMYIKILHFSRNDEEKRYEYIDGVSECELLTLEEFKNKYPDEE